MLSCRSAMYLCFEARDLTVFMPNEYYLSIHLLTDLSI